MVVVTRKMLDEMLRLAREGRPYAEIGTRVGGLPSYTVSKWVNQYGYRRRAFRARTPEVGERVRELHRKRVSPREICRRVGISRSTYWYWRKKLKLPGCTPKQIGQAGQRALRDRGIDCGERAREENERAGYPWCTKAQRRVLDSLRLHGMLTKPDLARLMGVGPSSPTVVLTGCIAAGWVVFVERCKLAGCDYRRYMLAPDLASRMRESGMGVVEPTGVTFHAVSVDEQLVFSATLNFKKPPRARARR